MIELNDVNVPDPAEGLPPWQDPDWLAAADDWISASCAEAALTRVGPARARCRMWSVVAQVPVVGGHVWFKANPPGSAFEPALGQALRGWSPEDAPPVLAVDRARAWSLAEDVGVRLDGVFAADPDIRHWYTPIRRYARLQIQLAERLPALAALGVPDLRPEVLADLTEAMFADPGITETVGTPHGPSEAEFHSAAERLPAVREQCIELAALGIPTSLDHSDLHPGNILGSGEQARPFDWGDAVLGHPFCSLLIVLRSGPQFCGVSPDGPEIAALREAYLGPWLDQGIAPEAARQAVDLALSVGVVARAVAWSRMFPCYRDNLEPRGNAARWLARVGTANPFTVATS